MSYKGTCYPGIVRKESESMARWTMPEAQNAVKAAFFKEMNNTAEA